MGLVTMPCVRYIMCSQCQSILQMFDSAAVQVIQGHVLRRHGEFAMYEIMNV